MENFEAAVFKKTCLFEIENPVFILKKKLLQNYFVRIKSAFHSAIFIFQILMHRL